MLGTIATRRPALATALALAALAGVGTNGAPPPVCDTVPACVARMRELARPDEGISPEQDALAERLQALSPESIPPLMALLRDGDPQVRELAGYVLRDMPGLEVRHLPELERAVEGGDGWLPPAIAAIGTPEAVRFLVGQLKKEPETETQLTRALAGLGPAAVPELIELFHCGTGCDEEVLDASAWILAEMREGAEEAVDPLARLATDRGGSLVVRRAALRALAGLGPSARSAVPGLLELLGQAPGDLHDEIGRAIVAIGGSGTKAVLEAALEDAARRNWALRDIVRLGEAGREAGPAVEKLLGSDDHDVTVAAAFTLGVIGYTPATAALEDALLDPDDWRLVLAAAESLGRLRATAARPALEATASGHWFPPVRAAARTALQALDGTHRYPAPERDTSWPVEEMRGESQSCADRLRFPPAPFRAEALDPTRQSVLAESLAYDREIRSYSPEGERVTQRRTVPKVGLRVDGAWLVGTSQGEWGGELVLKPDGGGTRMVLPTNIAGLDVLGDGQIVAVTGLAHLSMDRGVLYRITCPSSGSCRATWWKALPGAPKSAWVIEGGELLVDTTVGTVLVSPEGTLRMAECPTQPGDRPPGGSGPR